MNVQTRCLGLLGTLALSPAVLPGCAVMHADEGQLHVGDSIDVYMPFDNSRDWGPSYLVGAPGHHLGMGTRIDDNRAAPPTSSERIDDKTPVAPPASANPLRIIPCDCPTDNILDQAALIDSLSDEALGQHSDGCQHMTGERVPFELQCVDAP
jgi:hypothetical protein